MQDAPSRLVVRMAVVVLVVSVVFFLFSAPRAVAATTHHVHVGSETPATGANFTYGVVWFNGYDPNAIVIHPGDTIVWDAAGGVHTVTSAATNTDGSFVFDSSPLFTVQGALDDIGPGKLLAPGTVWSLDTTTLAPGTYSYACKIHPGMMGTLTITPPVASPGSVSIVAGFGDSVVAQQAFSPSAVSVPQGTTVEWRLLNPTEPHTVTHVPAAGPPLWDSSPNFNPPGPPPVMLPGSSFSQTFNQEGTFTYFCKVHAYNIGGSWVGMVGTVHVVPAYIIPNFVGPDAIAAVTVISAASIGVAALALAVAGFSAYRRK